MKHFMLSAFLMCLGNLFGQTNIVLISLDDKDTIDYRFPAFNWYYVSAPDGRDDVRYNFVLTELQPNQSPLIGVTVNQPLLRINGVQGFQLVYPFDAPELHYNHRYGWQIEKTVNNVITEKSEAWEFTLYRDIKMPAKYVYLNSDYSASIFEVEGEGFYFKMHERYRTTGNPQCRVMNESSVDMDVHLGEDLKYGNDDELEQSGREFHYLKTDSYPAGIYTLTVRDIKGNEYNTRFRIK